MSGLDPEDKPWWKRLLNNAKSLGHTAVVVLINSILGLFGQNLITYF